MDSLARVGQADRVLARFLRLADVDPARHPFDRDAARGLVRRVIQGAVRSPESRDFRDGWDRDRLEEALAMALVDSLGPWADAFRWAVSEPGGGGPVRTYCCPRDSLLRNDEPGIEPTVERVLASLEDFRSFVAELTERFAELRGETAALPLPDAIEIVAARLLPSVVERTDAEDAWYATYARVMTWYLEGAGLDADLFAPAIASAISGRFRSWVAPSKEAARETATALALAVSDRDEVPPLDALAEWEKTRARAFRMAPAASAVPVAWDGHLRFIEGPERARDEARAGRMREALLLCRASAARGEALDRSLLERWQAIVLGVERAAYRSTTAFAKGGRETYGFDDGTLPRFARWLDEANDATTDVFVRAARVHLDVCFTHPFVDGNARAARLAMEHVLARAGLVLRAVEPLFLVSRRATDADGAWSFAWLTARLAGRIVP